MERNWNETMQFDGLSKDLDNEAKRIFLTVYDALQVKGYNPVNQIVGYTLSGDPTYITSYNNSRRLIPSLERDELLEELVENYIENNRK